MGDTEHLDVLIVGAGLSGIGAGCHLQTQCPGKSYAILEAREAIGGTWDLFRYPGIRSDSDMYTLGYSFRPWQDAKAIADGPAILEYIRETAREYGDRPARSASATGSCAPSGRARTRAGRWRPSATDTERDRASSPAASCSCARGYYRYDEGYTPEFEGRERFRGPIVHPQQWPEDLDYAGKRVVVIGSGATAVTLVPAMAEQAAHVTMLQRSPSYVVSLPGRGPDRAARCAGSCRRRLAYPFVRWKNVLMTTVSFQLSRRRPKLIKALIRKGVERQLPAGYDIDTHFKPKYNPWDQRMCLVPDGDLFEAICSRHARRSSPTRSRRSPRTGIKLDVGRESSRPTSIVTATGLNMLVLGGRRRRGRRRAGRLLEDRGLQGHDVQRRARTWRSRSATRTRRGR